MNNKKNPNVLHVKIYPDIGDAYEVCVPYDVKKDLRPIEAIVDEWLNATNTHYISHYDVLKRGV